MIRFEAFYFDGKSSRKRAAEVEFSPPGTLRIGGLEKDLRYPLAEVRFSSQLGSTVRSVYLPDGAKLETTDHQAIDAILEQIQTGGWGRLRHLLESRSRFILPMVAMTILSLWGLIGYGLPFLATQVARAVPAGLRETMGEEALAMLDGALLRPSDLEPATQDSIRLLLVPISAGMENIYDLRLEFRASGRLGANALALPSGVIVMTDDLVRLAEHAEDLTAVLAHEAGHIVQRHSLRQLLQSAAIVLVMASLTGDLTSLTSLSAALPTLLVNAGYSRAFEREADEFALDYLASQGISSSHFAHILLRLVAAHSDDPEVHNYLASHPKTSQRIEAITGSRPRQP
ncbi:MAG: M48 family metallopeptidase [Candidatus Marinimicrobia bacterium]|nr:M48 family metallopeptidase [Candidatus Neomarinimicrobiota bacterium]